MITFFILFTQIQNFYLSFEPAPKTNNSDTTLEPQVKEKDEKDEIDITSIDNKKGAHNLLDNQEDANENKDDDKFQGNQKDNSENNDDGADTEEVAEEEEEEEETGPTIEELLLSVPKTQFDIPMEYTPQVVYWLRWYIERNRWGFQLWMKRSGAYKALITSELRKAGLPEDLFYVAMIESGFSPTATSQAEAVGIWQFIPSTGRNYGLQIDDYIDERRDPYRSTLSAIAYLKKLYREFGYWTLAIAAYNCGESRLHSAINTHNSVYFWNLLELNALPDETMEYLPKIYAAAILDKNNELFGISRLKADAPVERAFTIVDIPLSVTKLSEISTMKEVDFRSYNTHILGDSLPNAPTHIYVPPTNLNSLQKNLQRFDNKISSGRSLSDEEMKQLQSSNTTIIEDASYGRFHIVKENETLADISSRRGIAEEYLRDWNNLPTDIQPKVGQQLKLTAPKEKRWISHEVKRSETLSSIAKKYNVTSEDIQKWNILEESKVPTGTTLWLHVDLE